MVKNVIQPEDVEQAVLWYCPFCPAPVGFIFTTRRDFEFGVNAVGVPGNRICQACENDFVRQPLKKPPMTPSERKHNANYKKFLKGKAYKELRVTHTDRKGEMKEGPKS